MTENETSEVMRAIGRLEGKVDGVLKILDRGHRRMDNHGGRLKELEATQARATGRATVWGLVCGGSSAGVVTGIIAFLRHSSDVVK